jgi:FAD/FMN-containing dehydrogenase
MWNAQQQEIAPACRVEPSSSDEVSLILGILVKENCPFAIKSGGHSRIKNSSNSDGGVTIDLVRIKEVEISNDNKTVRLGSGALWLDVYDALEKQDLMVVGGRVGDVGVGGLLLGGKT